jgi:hypothetical protein
MASAFLEWFALQFGQRQRSGEIDAELMDIATAGRQAQAELDRRHAWDNQRTAAMYGWNVTDEGRKQYGKLAGKIEEEEAD